jgi:hypothetical protein
MYFVTLTTHSPSHASAMFEAKVMVINSRRTDSMVFWEVRGKRKRGRGEKRRRIVPLKFNHSAGVLEAHLRTTRLRLAAIARDLHSYSPAKLKFRIGDHGERRIVQIHYPRHHRHQHHPLDHPSRPLRRYRSSFRHNRYRILRLRRSLLPRVVNHYQFLPLPT